MDEVELQMEAVLAANPEFNFREICADLVKDGHLDYAVLDDPYIHAALHKRFAGAKARANMNRMNTDI